MNRKFYPFLFLFTALSLVFYGFENLQFLPDYKKKQANNGAEVIEGVIVVKFQNTLEVLDYDNPQTSAPQFNQLLKKHRISSIEAVFPKVAESGLVKAEEMAKIHFLRFTHPTAPAVLAADFGELRGVEYAEPKYKSYLQDVPNDPQYTIQGYLNNALNAEAAWDIAKAENGDVSVAIVDSGTDWPHEDLESNMWTNPNEIAGNGIDDDENGYVDDIRGWNFQSNNNNPQPNGNSHGTHVSGIAAAATDNGIGISSISWNPKLIGINASTPGSGAGISFGYEAIAYATTVNADVVNCSWGRGGAPSLFEEEVVDFATENNTLVIAAAGNGGTDNVGDSNDEMPFYPCNYKNALSVGATQDATDLIAGYSNYGLTVNVFAPGSGILSTYPDNTYGFNSGTSMASPVVAGLAAMVKATHPDWTAQQIGEQIRVTCDPIEGANSPQLAGFLGNGRINALRAVSEESPAIRLDSYFILDSGGDGELDAGESITLFLTFVNRLATTNGVAVFLSTDDENIQFINNADAISTIETNQLISTKFTFDIDPNAPRGQEVLFKIDLTNGIYTDYDLLKLTISPPKFIAHNTGPLRMSVSNQGSLGFAGFSGQAPGDGFSWNEQNLLFEGGLVMAASANQISDCIRGLGNEPNEEFKALDGEILQFVSPGEKAHEESSIVIVDSLATNPIGVSILQESYADTASSRQNFVILKYTLKNETPDTIDNLHVALFFDWDIGADFNDFGRLDEDRRLGYAYNSVGGKNYIGATKMLSSEVGYSYRTLHNPDELYDNFTDAEKWQFITGGIQTQDIDATDISTYSGAGPFKIAPNETAEVGFALIGAHGFEELAAAADTAQLVWDGLDIISSIDEIPVSKLTDLTLFPNPFYNDLKMSYELKQKDQVHISLFDMQGQRIEVLKDELQSAGTHHFNFDLTDKIPAGTYLLQLQIGEQALTKKVVRF
ncbi:MAG: S8 family serine peptidase [Chitinophagales bacterium]